MYEKRDWFLGDMICESLYTLQRWKKFCFFLLAFLIGTTQTVGAQLATPVSYQTTVKATVGDFFLNVSGFIAPYASLVMTSDNVILSSSVADALGNFSFSGLFIKRGFSGFCIKAVDFRLIGYSTACVNFPPASQNVSLDQLFLPPTIGISTTEFTEGLATTAFGYTMPLAAVKIDLGGGLTFTTSADTNGYYKTDITIPKAGKYNLVVTAVYQGKTSLDPKNPPQILVLSAFEQIQKTLKEKQSTLVSLVGIFGLLLILAIIILPIILFFFRKRGKLHFGVSKNAQKISFPKSKGKQ